MKKAVYWTKKDGTQILVDDMSLHHLRNSLKMILRSEAVYKSLKAQKDQMIENQNLYINEAIKGIKTLRCTVIFLLAIIACLTFIAVWF